MPDTEPAPLLSDKRGWFDGLGLIFVAVSTQKSERTFAVALKATIAKVESF